MNTNAFEPLDWAEGRRLRAWELFQQGWTPARIAEALGVSRAAVSQWLSRARDGGRAALRARPRHGAAPRLTDEQRRSIPELLEHGAEAYGFRGDVWTCARVAEVIARQFGIRYHKAHVSRLLKQLDWTPQQPITRATQRDEAAIGRWRNEVWPELKRSRDGTAEA
jgi:transposase